MSHQASKTEIVRCPHCGEENFSFAAFCLECGVSLDGEDAGVVVGQEAKSRTPFLPFGRKTWLPSASGRRGAEAAVGILLLLIISGYALFTWRASASRIDAYNQGQAAEQRHDWDGALAGFTRAGDFQDAPQRKRTVQQTVETRDRLYARELDDEGRGQWADAVASLDQLQSIQPSYRDVSGRLDRARAQLFSSSLGGLVYLVDAGPEAGLYIRDATGDAARLPGSDASSLVRAVAPGSAAIVYDRPAGPNDVCPSRSISAAGNGGRVAVLLTLKAGLPVSDQSLPCLPGDGRGIFATGGLWWATGVTGPVTSYREVYYRPDDPSLPLVRLPGEASGVRVVAFDPVGSRIVLVRSSPFPGAGHYDSHLFVAGADGSNPRPLQMLSGWLTQASVSADGRWLLATIERQNPLGGRAIMLLPMPGTAPRTGESGLSALLQGAVQLGAAVQEEDVSATFAQTKEGHTAIVLSSTDGVLSGLLVYDLDERPVAGNLGNLGSLGISWNKLVLAGMSADGGLLAFRGENGSEVKLGLLSLDAAHGLDWSELQVPARPGQTVQVEFSPRLDYAAISVANPGGEPLQTPSLFVAPITAGRLGEVLPVANMGRLTRQGAPLMSISRNGYVLSYVTSSGELNATFLDGRTPVTLTQGVSGVWSLGQ